MTAVEWLMDELVKKGLLVTDDINNLVSYNKAKEMEKQQIKEMYLKGIENYDTTFKNK